MRGRQRRRRIPSSTRACARWRGFQPLQSKKNYIPPVNANLRADRRIFRHLAIGTAVCLAVVPITLTPYGPQGARLRWLLVDAVGQLT